MSVALWASDAWRAEAVGWLDERLAEADMQRELAPHADEMLALGVPDMRPARIPARFEEALDAAWGYAGEADREGLARVVALRYSSPAAWPRSPGRSHGIGRSGPGGPDEVEERWVRAPIESLFDLLE